MGRSGYLSNVLFSVCRVKSCPGTIKIKPPIGICTDAALPIASLVGHKDERGFDVLSLRCF
ncbi:MAG: hypothetical protein KatS3mg104_1478 [Phycisphaerae bacterium]|nr:MAG: hypothetical protein KatS3mg104_1478 [Phycisphaerae bacterium]